MFVLLPMQATTNYSVRGLLPQLIQDIVVIQAFTEAQKSKLLGAFYPGYIVAMLPAGWAVQKYGPKLLLSADNYVQGLALLFTPTAAKLPNWAWHCCVFA
jgi:fucose permease